MKILLIGASSYVGARLYFDLSKKFEVIGTYNGKKLSEKFVHLDTTNPEEVEKVITNLKPNIIIHAASNADARWCEANPELAINLNQNATESIVNSANKFHAKVIYISSFAALKPENVYGRTKKASEGFVVQTEAGFAIVRPALTIGFSPNTANDRPFNRLLKNIDEKSEAIYDTSWHFQPTYAGHLSEVIIKIIERNLWGESINVSVKEEKNRFDVAKDILGAFGIEVKPVDKKDPTTPIIDSLYALDRLELPKYTYEEVIQKCIEEIKHRDQFVLK